MSCKRAVCLVAVMFALLISVDGRMKYRKLDKSDTKLGLEKRILQELNELLEKNKDLQLKDAAAENNLNKRASLNSVSDSQFDTDILAEHNRLRQEEATNETASYMFKMAQHADLASLAQDVADSCIFEHSDSRSNQYGFSSIGENLYMTTGGSKTVESVVQSWFEEKQYYNYETKGCSNVCGHYTQVVWANSKYLGCGLAFCPILHKPGSENITAVNYTNAYYVVCHYGPAGNIFGKDPYIKGNSTCEKCPNNCTDTSLCETDFEIVEPVVCKDKYTNCGDFESYCGIFDLVTDGCPLTCNSCGSRKKKRGFEANTAKRNFLDVLLKTYQASREFVKRILK